MEDFICSACGGRFATHERYDVEGIPLCPNCTEKLTVNCSDCGERILKENDKGDEADPLCSTCWNRYIIG